MAATASLHSSKISADLCEALEGMSHLDADTLNTL